MARRLIRRFLVVTALIMLLLGVLTLVSYISWRVSADQKTAGDLTKLRVLLHQQLPPGSTPARVRSFLQSEAFSSFQMTRHLDYMQTDPPSQPYVEGHDLIAYLDGTNYDLCRSLVMRFRFSTSYRLTDIALHEDDYFLCGRPGL